MNTTNGFAAVMVAALMGCGGMDDGQKLSELSADEAKDLCLELVDDYPRKTITCGSTTVTIGLSAAECGTELTPASCTATVGDSRDCTAALYAQAEACMFDAPLPSACAKLAGCGGID